MGATNLRLATHLHLACLLLLVLPDDFVDNCLLFIGDHLIDLGMVLLFDKVLSQAVYLAHHVR